MALSFSEFTIKRHAFVFIAPKVYCLGNTFLTSALLNELGMVRTSLCIS